MKRPKQGSKPRPDRRVYDIYGWTEHSLWSHQGDNERQEGASQPIYVINAFAKESNKIVRILKAIEVAINSLERMMVNNVGVWTESRKDRKETTKIFMGLVQRATQAGRNAVSWLDSFRTNFM